MKLDITLSYTIIEFFLENLNEFEANNIGLRILQAIQQHYINLTYELEDNYDKYFQNKRMDLLDMYRTFISNIITTNEYSKLIEELPEYNEINTLVNDGYYKNLLSVCFNSSDKILLSDDNCPYDSKLIDLGITKVRNNEILDVNSNNIFNFYVLPIFARRITVGLPSSVIGKWIGRYLENETDIEIIDGYIYQNIDNFNEYFLKYIKHGANIKIYTIIDRGCTKTDIINEFKSSKYLLWRIEVFIISSKKEQHARNIFTNNYYIHLEKGMNIFGKDGFTYQSDVTVGFRRDAGKYEISNTEKVI